MNKFKKTCVVLLGGVLLPISILSCNSDEGIQSDSIEISQNSLYKALPGYADDFYLGQIGGEKSRYLDVEKGECFSGKGDCADDDLVIIVEPKKNIYSQLVNGNISFKDSFRLNKDILLEDIHPILVYGTIDGFFDLDIQTNKETNTHFFNFIRLSDKVNIGTYPVRIK